MMILVAFAGSALGQTTIASTEDAKSLGYPDGRKIVRDKSGNLYTAFRKKLNGWYQVYVAKSTNGGSTWSTPASPISTVAGSFHQRVPSISIDSDDVIHVVWYGQDNANSGTNERQIKYSRSSDGAASWSGWQNIAPVAGYSSGSYWQEHPVSYIDAANNIYVVWEGRDSTYSSSSQTKFIRSTDGGINWTAWKNVSPISTNQSRPTLVVDSAGKIFVIAYGYWAATGKQNILYSTSTDGGATFSSWNAVAASSAYEQRHPTAAIDSGNKIHLAWRQEDAGSGGNSVIKYAKFSSPNWSSASTVSATSGYFQFFPSISNSHGSQYIVWTETTDASGFPSENPATGRIVMAKRLQGSSSWVKSNLTGYGTNVFGSVRWSQTAMNGGTVDIVYSTGSANPFQLKYITAGNWGTRSDLTTSR